MEVPYLGIYARSFLPNPTFFLPMRLLYLAGKRNLQDVSWLPSPALGEGLGVREMF